MKFDDLSNLCGEISRPLSKIIFLLMFFNSICLGIFTIEPKEGEALNTDFKMKAAEGWSDADGDALNYQFAYKKDE